MRGVERGEDALASAGKPADNRLLAGACGNQLDRVNAAALPETIDASDALLETKRRPRQLQVHDQPASMVKVQSFARRIRREQQA